MIFLFIFRLNLHSLASCEKQKATNASFVTTNYRYLTKRLLDNQKENRSLKKRINNLEEKIANITNRGVDLDDKTSHAIRWYKMSSQL